MTHVLTAIQQDLLRALCAFSELNTHYEMQDISRDLDRLAQTQQQPEDRTAWRLALSYAYEDLQNKQTSLDHAISRLCSLTGPPTQATIRNLYPQNANGMQMVPPASAMQDGLAMWHPLTTIELLRKRFIVVVSARTIKGQITLNLQAQLKQAVAGSLPLVLDDVNVAVVALAQAQGGSSLAALQRVRAEIAAPKAEAAACGAARGDVQAGDGQDRGVPVQQGGELSVIDPQLEALPM